MASIGRVQTKGLLNTDGSSLSRELIITIEEIESMKQEKEILAGVRKILTTLGGQNEL